MKTSEIPSRHKTTKQRGQDETARCQNHTRSVLAKLVLAAKKQSPRRQTRKFVKFSSRTKPNYTRATELVPPPASAILAQQSTPGRKIDTGRRKRDRASNAIVPPPLTILSLSSCHPNPPDGCPSFQE